MSEAMARRYIAKAKDVCAACPVRQACLEYALTWGEQGVWGGMTEDERKSLSRRRGIVPLQRPRWLIGTRVEPDPEPTWDGYEDGLDVDEGIM